MHLRYIESEEKDAPVPNTNAALCLMDYWIEELHCKGIEVRDAELVTKRDYDEVFWYFVIYLYVARPQDMKEHFMLTRIQADIIEKMLGDMKVSPLADVFLVRIKFKEEEL